MKILSSCAAALAVTITIFSSPVLTAQTCVAGIQASNPTSVYVIDAVNGTVTDTRTGLMWDRCAHGQSGPACGTDSATTFTWQAALNLPATIGAYKGYSDWRLPNWKELHSLVEECRFNPSINEIAFPATAAYFWSGSPYAGAGAVATSWSVGFIYGFASNDFRSGDSQVRLVRGGQ